MAPQGSLHSGPVGPSGAVQSFGAGLKSHVHYHILISDGVWFPDGSYYALGHWDQSSLLGQLRHSILKSLVARRCLQPETAALLESWHPISPNGESSPRTPSGPLDRSGFSAFVGEPISQPTDRPRLERVLNYILRPALPLKHLSYVESSGQVRYSPPRANSKIWEHTFDFLADWVQHIPRARQHQVTYAGPEGVLALEPGRANVCWFANALGKLNPKKEPAEETEDPAPTGANKWVKWPRRGSRTRAPSGATGAYPHFALLGRRPRTLPEVRQRDEALQNTQRTA